MTWMGRNLVESTEKPGGPGMWEGEKGERRDASDTSDYRHAARCGGASQGKRAMVRRSMSAGVLLIHNSIAGLVTLLDLSRTTSTDPVNIQMSWGSPRR